MQTPKTIASTLVFFYPDSKIAIGTVLPSTVMSDAPTVIPAMLPLLTAALNEENC